MPRGGVGDTLSRLSTRDDTFMDTKRCAYCHKLVRADAHICSGCGRPFVAKQARAPSPGGTQPSLPAASPHRAGHYFGLHPEDQPYQSGMMAAVQRPIEPDADPRHLPQQEPAELLLPVVNTPPRFIGRRDMTPPPDLDDLPTLEKTWNAPQSLRPPRISQRKNSPLTQERAIPILLTLAGIFFLLASSILAFVVLRKPSVVSISTAKLVASPTLLRVGDVCVLTGTNFVPNNPITFTYDGSKALIDEAGKRQLVARADEKGFFQVSIQIPADWKQGRHTIYATDEAQRLSIEAELTVQSPPATPPQLQLSISTLDLGSARAGAVSNKSLILKNGGGGQITWQAQSTDPWLTAAPNAGTFSGSQAITILVNRSSLVAQAYTGHISFVQYPGAPPVTLTVTMSVTAAPAALNISRGALAFSANQGQGTSPQTITLQNSGEQPLNWGSNVNTGDGNPWLSISPTSGQIDPNASDVVTISVQPQLLQAGSYTATIAFTGGASAQVSVALTVIPPGYLSMSSSSLSFATVAGQSPAVQTITLQNIGGLPLNWAATVDASSWLSVTPASGSLDTGVQVTVTVNINGSVLTPGGYHGTITFKNGDFTPQVGVAVTVNPAPTPAINVQNTPLSFTTYKGSNPTPKTFTLTNIGNAPLNWTASEDGNGASFAPVNRTSGQVAPGKSVVLTVSPNVLGYGAGILSTVITIADSDPGTKVSSQKLAVTITVLDQAAITLSTNTLSLTTSSTTRDTAQLLTITNTGSSDLNWSIVLNEGVGANISWLSVDLPSATLSPGARSVVNVHYDSTQLSSGTYTATLTVSDSDPGTPVSSQVVQITLTVQ